MYQFYEKLSERKTSFPSKKTVPKYLKPRQTIPMEKPKEIMDIEKPEDLKTTEVKISLPKGVIQGSDGKFASANPDAPKIPKKPKPEWDESYTMLSLNPPVPFSHPKMNKRFFITFVYRKAGLVHKKTVKFGKIGQNEFIDHKNKEEREKLLKSMKSYHNPFKANHWRFYLLNQCTDMKEAYMKYITEKNFF